MKMKFHPALIHGILLSLILVGVAQAAAPETAAPKSTIPESTAPGKDNAPAARTQTVMDSNRCASFEGPADYTFEAIQKDLPEGRSVTVGKGPDQSSIALFTFEKKTTDATAQEVLDLVSEKFAKTTTPPKHFTLDEMPVLFRKFRMQAKKSTITLQFAVFTTPTHYLVLMSNFDEPTLGVRQPQFERAMATLKSLTPPAAKEPPASPAK